MPTELNIPKVLLGMELPYPLYEQAKRLIDAHQGVIQEQTFAGNVLVMAQFPISEAPAFQAALVELSAGRVNR